MSQTDKEYMLRAIELAKRGIGFVNPNPMVGAVIVKDGRIISEGYHHRYGDLHAERDAFSRLTESAEGATIYVTLEPCCHIGKQPPCTEAIIENKIKRVVIGSRDPNPLVSGKGCRILREHGIEVVEDFMREECDEINPVFFHFITTNMPYVVMKYAMTLDGKIATHTGESKWITGEVARRHVHKERAKYAAIMAGIGTVISDDPMLNVRVDGEELHQPVRIIVDSELRIPLDSNIVKTAKEHKTYVAYNEKCLEKEMLPDSNVSKSEEYVTQGDCEEKRLSKKDALMESGIELLECSGDDGKVDITKLFRKLGELKIDSIFVEGGGRIHEAVLRTGYVNHVMAYVAPKLFGGKDAKTPVEGQGIETPSDCVKLSFTKMTQLGDDILLECDIKEEN